MYSNFKNKFYTLNPVEFTIAPNKLCYINTRDIDHNNIQRRAYVHLSREPYHAERCQLNLFILFKKCCFKVPLKTFTIIIRIPRKFCWLHNSFYLPAELVKNHLISNYPIHLWEFPFILCVRFSFTCSIL